MESYAVRAGYLPFTWDEEHFFIRCIKLDAMPDADSTEPK